MICVACVEPAWPAWNLRAWHLPGLRGTCVEPAWPAWNLRGTCVACVEPAWPAWNLRAWHLRGLRATCVACGQPAWHLRGTTCMEKPEEFFFFPPGTAKTVKPAENATKTRKNDCSVTWGEKRIVVFTWGFLRVALPTQKIGKVLPSCPQNKFSPHFFLVCKGWLGKVRKGVFGILPMILIQRNHFLPPKYPKDPSVLKIIRR